jgi:hypothetical protein
LLPTQHCPPRRTRDLLPSRQWTVDAAAVAVLALRGKPQETHPPPCTRGAERRHSEAKGPVHDRRAP